MSRPETTDYSAYSGAEFNQAVEFLTENRDLRPVIPELRKRFPTLSALDCCAVIRAVNLAERWPEKAGGGNGITS